MRDHRLHSYSLGLFISLKIKYSVSLVHATKIAWIGVMLKVIDFMKYLHHHVTDRLSKTLEVTNRSCAQPKSRLP